jgi:hypothetical protein
VTFLHVSAIGAAARAIYTTAAFDTGTVLDRNDAVKMALAAVADASPHLRAEFAADMSDALADTQPEVALLLDQLSADYREELFS